MQLIIVSDIFGRTPALEAVCKAITPNGSGVRIIDPYDGADQGFDTEASAYEAFSSQVGMAQYESILFNTLVSCKNPTVLVGFSAGASAIWGVSEQKALSHVKKAFCFYGSQIRNKPGIEPAFDIDLVFPKYESHFDVDLLMRHLKKKNRASCKKTDYLHGFMNQLSVNYDPMGYQEHSTALKREISNFLFTKP